MHSSKLFLPHCNRSFLTLRSQMYKFRFPREFPASHRSRQMPPPSPIRLANRTLCQTRTETVRRARNGRLRRDGLAPLNNNRDREPRAMDTRTGSALFKRAEQLRRWEESDTNREPSQPRRRAARRINFSSGCVFLAACAAADKDEVLRLLRDGADVDTANVDGLTALHQVSTGDGPPVAVGAPVPGGRWRKGGAVNMAAAAEREWNYLRRVKTACKAFWE